MRSWVAIVGIISALLWCGSAHSIDIYKVKKNRLFVTPTAVFCYEVLEQALAATYAKPDSFKLEYVFVNTDEFTYKLMYNDTYTDMLDITFAIPRPHWEQHLYVVRVPLLFGYMGYRISFIHQDNIEKFKNITDVEQLKSFRLGAGEDWATAAIHKAHGFNTIGTNAPPALINLLMKKRIDYVARGATEILREYQKFKPDNNNLLIEPNFMIRIPLPFYFFVNPQKPELGERLHQGLLTLIKTGKYQKIFNKHFGDFITNLNLNSRTVFNIDNPNISAESRDNVLNFWSQLTFDRN